MLMDTDRLAKLSQLTKSDVEANKKNLSLVIDAFKKIEEVNTEDILPIVTPIEVSKSYRKDITNTSETDNLTNAPDKLGRSFKVPFKL